MWGGWIFTSASGLGGGWEYIVVFWEPNTLSICCSLQVVVCSFVYGGSKTKPKQLALAGAIGNDGSEAQRSDKLATPTSAPSSQNYNPSGISVWHGSRQAELRNNPHTGIDLTRGWKFAATDTWQFCIYVLLYMNLMILREL